MSAQQRGGGKAAKGAFRIAGKILFEAGKEAARQAAENREQARAQQQQQQQQATLPVAQGMPVAQAVQVAPQQTQQQAYQQQPPVRQPAAQQSGYSNGRTPAVFNNEGPNVYYTTCGWDWGVGKCSRQAIQDQFVAADIDAKKFWKQLDDACKTPLVSCCLVLAVIVGAFLTALLHTFVLGLGNTIGYLILLPHTIGSYTYYMCSSPRISPPLKALLTLAFPLYAVICFLPVMLISFGVGFLTGFTPVPHPLFLPFEATGLFFSQGRKWRTHAYKELANEDGPQYDLGALSCLLIIPYMLLGLVWGLAAFLVIAVLESPRMWWHVSFGNYQRQNCCPCIDDCIICCMPFVAIGYVFCMVLSAPFIGLITGCVTGYGAAINHQNFFLAEWEMAKEYLNGLDHTRSQ